MRRKSDRRFERFRTGSVSVSKRASICPSLYANNYQPLTRMLGVVGIISQRSSEQCYALVSPFSLHALHLPTAMRACRAEVLQVWAD
jgi:hypothetical protein